MKEQEIWGLLTEKQFKEFKSVFSREFGDPIRKKRLAIQLWSGKTKKSKRVSTRIRITNGKPQIIHKIGDWENSKEWKFKELSINLPQDTKAVFNTFLVLRNITSEDTEIFIIQHELYLFKNKSVEIKLAKQFGKSKKYIFEVELKKEGQNLEKLVKKLGLAEYMRTTDVAFWDKWNKEVNINVRKITDLKIKNIINSYLYKK